MIQQLSFFKTSLRKDLRYVFSPTVKVIFIVSVISIFFLSIGFFTTLYAEKTPVRQHDPSEDFHQYRFADDPESDDGGDDYWGSSSEDPVDEEGFFWGEEKYLLFDTSTEVAIMYGVIFILGIEFLLVLFHGAVFSQDQIKGAIRTWFHYPISVKSYILSKVFNIILFTVLLSLVIYGLALLGTVLGLKVVTIFSLVSVTMFVLILNYLAYVGVFSIMAKAGLRGRLTDPALLFIAGNSILLLMTETGISAIYMGICELQSWTYEKPFITLLKYLSPYHFLGSFYDWSYYGDPMSVLDFIWFLPILALIGFGFYFLKDLYPDMFIRETA